MTRHGGTDPGAVAHLADPLHLAQHRGAPADPVTEGVVREADQVDPGAAYSINGFS